MFGKFLSFCFRGIPKSQISCVGVGGRRLQYRRQRGSSVPDSWLNFRWTLSNCRVRTNSWGTMAAELSLSKLSFRLLKNRQWAERKSRSHLRGMEVRKSEMVQSAMRELLSVKNSYSKGNGSACLLMRMNTRISQFHPENCYLPLKTTSWFPQKNKGVVTNH